MQHACADRPVRRVLSADPGSAENLSAVHVGWILRVGYDDPRTGRRVGELDAALGKLVEDEPARRLRQALAKIGEYVASIHQLRMPITLDTKSLQGILEFEQLKVL